MKRLSLIAILILLCSCSKLVLHPKSELDFTPADFGYKYQNVFIDTDSGKLHAWFIASSKKSKGTVLFLHSNAGNISSHFVTASWLANQGYNLLLPDYSGYGRSEGRTSLNSIHRDLEPVLAYLSKQESLKPIAIWGQDLGANLGMYLAANSFYRSNLCLLIAEGTVPSYQDVFKKRLEKYWLLKPISRPLSKLMDDSLSARKYISKISPLPLLMVHGTHDNITPLDRAQALFKLAIAPKEFWKIDGAQHINSFYRNQKRQAALSGYLDNFCAELPAPN